VRPAVLRFSPPAPLLGACFAALVFASCLGFVNSRYRVVGAVLLPSALVFLRECLRARGKNLGARHGVALLCLAAVAFWPMTLDRAKFREGARRTHQAAARIAARGSSMDREAFSRYYAGRRSSFVARYTDERLLE
jgi:hypothetical protein